ncbi:hypothetical protein JY476_07080 [Serratia marcescens]|nr:hypothetical protein [Serratia marcescens]
MTTYNTGNELGSTDPRDLYDNAENLDKLLLGEQHNYPDRLNKLRVSWSGFEYYIKNSGAAMAFATEQELLAFTPDTANVLAQVTSTGVFYYWNGTLWSKSTYQPTLDVLRPYRLGLFTSGKNKYNYKTSLDGKYINESGVISDSSVHTLSTYIGVKAGVMYLSNYQLRFVSYFDKNQAFIGYAENQLTFTPPQNTSFIRITVIITAKHLVQIEKGGSRTAYEMYIDNFRRENDDFAKISLRSAMGYEKGKNLFNPALAMRGYFINNSGVLFQSAAHCTSDYIPIIGGSDYRANQQISSVVFYDVDKTLISGSLDVSSYFTAPMNAAYIRCSVLLDRISVTQVELGRNLTTFEQFGIAPPMAIDNMPVAFPRQHVGPDDVGIFEPGKNIFNPYTLSNGFIDEWGFYNPDGSSFRVSDYIAIESGVSYVSNKQMRFATFYDANKAFISTTAFIGTFTSPVNSAYVRITVTIASSAGFQLEKGTAVTEYEEYHYGIKPKLDNGTPIVIDSNSASETPDYFGLERLRETHMRLLKLSYGDATRLTYAMIGDSYTRGQARYALKVAQNLWNRFNNSPINTVVPPLGCGWRSFGFDQFGDNTDIVGTVINQSTDVTCAYKTGHGPDISATTMSATSATISYMQDLSKGFISALYAEGGSGVIQYQATGMADPVQIDLSTYPTGMQIIPLTIPSGGSASTVTWTCMTAPAVLYGVKIVHPTANGVVVHKMAGSGLHSNNWVTAMDARWSTALTDLAPDLVTIMLGTNDQEAKISAATFRSNMLTMIDTIRAVRPTADILLICPAENNRPGGNIISMTTYADVMYKVARDDRDVAFLNLQASFGEKASDYAAGSARPWMLGDGLHPANETGGYAIASAIIRALRLPL